MPYTTFSHYFLWERRQIAQVGILLLLPNKIPDGKRHVVFGEMTFLRLHVAAEFLESLCVIEYLRNAAAQLQMRVVLPVGISLSQHEHHRWENKHCSVLRHFLRACRIVKRSVSFVKFLHNSAHLKMPYWFFNIFYLINHHQGLLPHLHRREVALVLIP